MSRTVYARSDYRVDGPNEGGYRIIAYFSRCESLDFSVSGMLGFWPHVY